MTASRINTAAAAVAGAATLDLPPFPVGIDAQDLVTIIRRQLLIAEYVAEVTGRGPSSEALALRWVLATISDHAASVAAETGNSLYRWTATQLHHAARLPDDIDGDLDTGHLDTGTVVPTIPAAVVGHDHDTTQPCGVCVDLIAAERDC